MFKSNLASYKEITRDESKKFIEQHYLGKFPASSSEYVGIFYNDKLVGVVIYGSPASPSAINIFKPEANAVPENLIELQRLFITGDTNVLPEDDRKGLAGYSIVRGNELVSKKRPNLKAIISYSDPAKHQGTVYKATGAIYLGRGKDYYEFDKGDGKILRQSRATPEQKKTLQKIKINGKDRYVYPVGSNSQRNWVKRHLNMPSITEMLWEDFKSNILSE